MAEFQEWVDAVGDDGDGLELFGESSEDAGLRNQRDAVLFCIDARAASFVCAEQASPAPFTSFVKHTLRFCQDKIVTSDRDLVGVVLFGTDQECNTYGFPSLYVFHELDMCSAARVQELELLATAATPGAPLAAEFDRKIGHCDSGGSARPFAMSELLWSVLHLFNLVSLKRVAFRRAFIFTCDDDPCKGTAVERAKCFARARDLKEHGIFVEVFGHGSDAVPAVWTAPASASASAGGSALGSGNVVASGFPNASRAPSLSPQTAAVMVSGPPSLAPAPTTLAVTPPPPIAQAPVGGAGSTGLPPFDRSLFWGPLLAVAAPTSGPTRPSSGSRESSLGSVHVTDLSKEVFAGALGEHRIRTYPQRSVGTLSLSIGPDVTAPSLPVSVFLPVVRCPKPKFTWLEAATNAPVVAGESRLIARETARPVAADELLYTAKVGGPGEVTRFAGEEVKRLRSQFGPPGIRILGFRGEASLRHKWCIGHSSFLHPNEARCGPSGMVLFKELYRVLRESRRYAIAEVIARDGSVPRLVALIAAGPDNTVAAAVEPGSVGFHMFPLPYADDYRSLNLSKECFAKATPEAVSVARTVVQQLTVPYDPTAVTNPVLQHHYYYLQQLAVMNDAESKPPDDLSLPDREGMAAFAGLFDTFKKTVYGDQASTYAPDAIAPLPKAAKPAPSAADLATVDIDALESAGQLHTLTVPYLKQYLKEHHESTTGVKQDLIDRVTKVLGKNRAVKRAREGDGNV